MFVFHNSQIPVYVHVIFANTIQTGENVLKSLLYIKEFIFMEQSIKKFYSFSRALSTYMFRWLIYLFCCLPISIIKDGKWSMGDATIGERTDQCVRVHWAPPINGRKLVTIALSSEKTSDIKDCVLKCFTTNGCVALNFGPRQGKHHVCELLKTNRHFLFSNFTAMPGWTYVGKQVWNIEIISSWRKRSNVAVLYETLDFFAGKIQSLKLVR